jgi:hypothetical protein
MSPARFSVPHAGKSRSSHTGCRARCGSHGAPSPARGDWSGLTLPCRGGSWREGGIEG